MVGESSGLEIAAAVPFTSAACFASSFFARSLQTDFSKAALSGTKLLSSSCRHCTTSALDTDAKCVAPLELTSGKPPYLAPRTYQAAAGVAQYQPENLMPGCLWVQMPSLCDAQRRRLFFFFSLPSVLHAQKHWKGSTQCWVCWRCKPSHYCTSCWAEARQHIHSRAQNACQHLPTALLVTRHAIIPRSETKGEACNAKDSGETGGEDHVSVMHL